MNKPKHTALASSALTLSPSRPAQPPAVRLIPPSSPLSVSVVTSPPPHAANCLAASQEFLQDFGSSSVGDFPMAQFKGAPCPPCLSRLAPAPVEAQAHYISKCSHRCKQPNQNRVERQLISNRRTDSPHSHDGSFRWWQTQITINSWTSSVPAG
jgi:hypothetical protein